MFLLRQVFPGSFRLSTGCGVCLEDYSFRFLSFTKHKLRRATKSKFKLMATRGEEKYELSSRLSCSSGSQNNYRAMELKANQ